MRFSALALRRLRSRNITITDDDVVRLVAMMRKAAIKGAQQALFIVRDTAILVSIKNRTIITAIDQKSMKDHVFTDIDSTAIL